MFLTWDSEGEEQPEAVFLKVKIIQLEAVYESKLIQVINSEGSVYNLGQ